MKKTIYMIIGTVLLLPVYISDALGINIDTFDEEVFRPENLPSGRKDASASVEVKINEMLQFVINLILYVAGSAAVFFLILGGIRYITSFGNQERMDGAKKTIKYAVIGLFAIILSYAAVTNIINLIYSATA